MTDTRPDLAAIKARADAATASRFDGPHAQAQRDRLALLAEVERLREAIKAAVVDEGCSCSDYDEPEGTCPMHRLEAAITPDGES